MNATIDVWTNMDDFIGEFITVISSVILCVSSFYAAIRLFKDHRATAVAFLLISCSSFLSSFNIESVKPLQKELEWAGEILGPTLCAYDFLWLSKDHINACLLLVGATALIMLSDWLSADGLVVMSCCMAFFSISCSLTACAFAENAAGALGSLALGLPLFVSSIVSAETLGLLNWTLNFMMTLGCLITRKGLTKFLFDLKIWD